VASHRTPEFRANGFNDLRRFAPQISLAVFDAEEADDGELAGERGAKRR